jgi:hypothetical protein
MSSRAISLVRSSQRWLESSPSLLRRRVVGGGQTSTSASSAPLAVAVRSIGTLRSKADGGRPPIIQARSFPLLSPTCFGESSVFRSAAKAGDGEHQRFARSHLIPRRFGFGLPQRVPGPDLRLQLVPERGWRNAPQEVGLSYYQASRLESCRPAAPEEDSAHGASRARFFSCVGRTYECGRFRGVDMLLSRDSPFESSLLLKGGSDSAVSDELSCFARTTGEGSCLQHSRGRV